MDDKCPIPAGDFIEAPGDGYGKTTCDTGYTRPAELSVAKRGAYKAMDYTSKGPPTLGPIEPPAATSIMQSLLAPKPPT